MDAWSIVAGFASVIAILTGVFTFIQWWRTPAHRLEAVVGWNAYTLPPQVEAEFASQARKVREAIKTFQDTHPKQPGAAATHVLLEGLAWQVNHVLESDIPLQLRFLYGCWTAKIRNTGKKKCVDINIKLPSAVYASVKHDREKDAKALTITEVVHLGELRPNGECEVTAWTDGFLGNERYSAVHLSHESGVGRVRGEWRTDRLGFVAGNCVKFFAVLLLFWACLFALFQGVMWLTSAKRPLPAAIAVLEHSKLAASYDEFVNRYKELQGRDGEQEEYVDQAAGKEISWDVAFQGATTLNDRVQVSFLSATPRDLSLLLEPVSSGSVPISQRDRVFALHRGDVVHIRGQLVKLLGKVLNVEITDFELVKRAAEVSPTPKS